MVLKPSGSKLPSKPAMLFNGAAALILFAAGTVAVRTTFFVDDMPPCSQRYPQAQLMPLERDGRALRVSDLQAVLRNTDWGLLQNAQVVGLGSGPASYALEFKTVVARPTAGDPDRKPGVGFVWTPEAMPRTTAGCLAYSVFIPEGFEFGAGGRLPGLLGTRQNAVASADPSFSFRYVWSEDGALGLHTQMPEWAEGRPLTNNRGTLRLERNRWTALEQEIVLNTSGKADGAVRIWANGALVFESTGLVIRRQDNVMISGVLAEMLARPLARSVLKPASIQLSPFEVRW